MFDKIKPASKHLVKKVLKKIDILEKQNDYLKRLLFASIDITKLPISNGILHDIQKLEFQLLVKFDEICRKYSLRYWLDYGTLLGAVRHQGFIPWDDDLDVSMPISDYKKFLDIVEDELNGTDYTFLRVPSQIGKLINRSFAPVNEKETTEFIFWAKKDKPIFALDIFPFYPSNKNIDELKSRIIEFCNIKTAIFGHSERYENFNNANIPVISAAENLSCSESNANYFYQGIESRVYQPIIRKTDDLFPLKELNFGGRLFFVPCNYISILTDIYGDFMQWPNDIWPHHLYLNSWSKEDLKKIKQLSGNDVKYDKTKNQAYWNKFYTKKSNHSMIASPFAQWVLPWLHKNKCKKILEIGCGNGRDSIFLAKNGMSVLGIDMADYSIDYLKKNYSEQNISFEAHDFTIYKNPAAFDAVYSRFVLHAIDEDGELETIKNTYINLKKNGLFFIEARSIKDKMFEKSVKISKNEGFTDHYRRFMDINITEKRLIKAGFEIIFKTESIGLAVYKNEDPMIVRFIAQKI